MALLMLLLLIFFTLFAFHFGGKSLVSPWFFLCLMFLASYVIILLNYENWQVQINGTFVLYICSAIIAFGVGTAIVKSMYPVCAVGHEKKLPITEAKIVKKYPVNLFIILSLISACGYIAKLIIDAGLSVSLSEIIRKIYDNIVSDGYSPGVIFNQMLEIVVAIAYINAFRLFIKLFAGKTDTISIVKLLIPLIIFFITVMISSDRNIFIRFAIYLICLWAFFFYENYSKKHVNSKIIFIVAIMIAIAALLFFILGRMKQYDSDFFKSVSIYAGSGLYDFNLWIADFDSSTLLYGQSTFLTLLNTLNTLLQPFGINISTGISQFDPFLEFTSSNGYIYSSNIYTALRPYVEDFGYFGVLFFPFIIGIFYQWLYARARNNKYGFSWLLYCMLIYPIIFSPILEQLFRRFHLGFVYELFWLFVLYKCVFGRKKNESRRELQIVGQRDKRS